MNKSQMKVGQKVKVFQKPFTDEDFEGIGKLVEFISYSEGYGTETWYVKFDNETETYCRHVKVSNLVK